MAPRAPKWFTRSEGQGMFKIQPIFNEQLTNKASMSVWSVGFLVTVLLCCGLHYSGGMQTLDYRLFDWQAQILREHYPRPVVNEVAIVGIDDASDQVYDEPLVLWHHHLADALRAITLAEPHAIVMDIALPDASMNRFLPGADQDLLKALILARQHSKLVIALTYDSIDGQGELRRIYPAFLSAAGEDGLGVAHFPRDGDQAIRRFDEYLAEDGSALPTLAGTVVRKLGVTPHYGYIDYSIGERFDYQSLHSVVDLANQGNIVQLQALFKNKVVMLGIVMQGEDRVTQSVRLAAWEDDLMTPGVLIQAQAIRSMLNQGLLQPPGLFPTTSIVISMALFWFVSMRTRVVLICLPAITAVIFATGLCLQTRGVLLPLAPIILSLWIALLGREIFGNYCRLLEKQQLKQAFSGYVSPAIMQEILAGRLTPSRQGERASVCVLFADIRNYTAMSEHMEPEAVIRFLNRYYEKVVKVIHEHGGSVTSFMGDGIMAVFGAPQPQDNPSVAALQSAQGMLSAVNALNQAKEGQQHPIRIGIGLHAGMAVMGHVGAASRHDYSAIGDVTNTASRIEGLTKQVGFPIVCSKIVFDAAGQPADFEALGAKSIKGHSSVEVFGVNHKPGE